MDRKACQSGLFYPAYREDCLNALNSCIPASIQAPSTIVAGVVPHAGWSFSGPTAGKVYRAIEQTGHPKTFVVFGAVHTYGVSKAAIWSDGKWATPLGEIEIDRDIAQKILKHPKGFIEDNREPHISEHSIEVQVPFIQHLFAGARLVPIMVVPFTDAYKIGEWVASVVGDNACVAIASADLTHYGRRFGFTPRGAGKEGLTWAKEENDRRMVELMLKVQPEKVVPEAMANHNSCGSGAIAAALGYARTLGKTTGTLLEHTTSFEVYPEPRSDCTVGYAGVVF